MDTLILLQGKGTDLKYDFAIPIHIKNLKLAFYTLSTYYSWANIRDKNNKLAYSRGGRKKVITIPKGAYDFTDIASYIAKNLKNNGDEDAFEISANNNTLHSVITIKKGKIHLAESSIKTVLGFTTDRELAAGTHNSDKEVSITSINRVLINCDIVNGAYQPTFAGSGSSQGSRLVQQNVIGSFYPSVEPGYKINIEKLKLFYTDVLDETVKSIRVWLTDQDGNPIDNGSEYLGIELHLKN